MCVFYSDLQWIPRQLRESVSIAMMEQPSPAALDQYLPRIREVIVHLLHGLKGKQAQLREKDRESRASVRSSSNSDAWNREVPLAALNRGSSTSSNGSQRMMMYPNNSPPLPPMSSPRMNGAEYDTWSGGMPRPSVPTNDLSARIMPKRPYSPPPPPHGSPLVPLPTRSTSSSRQHIPNPPPPPPAPPSNNVNNQPQTFDENDPNTASALAALKRQENLARRSSVRRASMYRGNSDYYSSISSRMQDTPPVPALPKSQLARTVPEEPEESHEEEEKGLTLFLQIGKQVKKTSYQGEISIPALNMLFVEKFNYTSRQNDFPNIYIRDPSIGVSYELTDISEVKDKSVLSLNIDGKENEYIA